MVFEQFIHQISKNLKQYLPGLEAQLKMAPDIRFKEAGPGNSILKAGVLILLYPKKDGIYTVFMKRPENSGVHSGQISLPGGKQEKYDKDIVATAFRETHEEIGVDTKKISLIGRLTSLYIQPSNFMVYPIIGYMNETPTFKLDPIEVEHIIEAQINTLSNPEIKEQKNIKRKDFDIIAPYYNLNGSHIWGATGMIISEFLEIINIQNYSSKMFL